MISRASSSLPWSAIIFVSRDADIDICERSSRSSRRCERSDCSFDLRNEAADFRNDREEPMLASSHVTTEDGTGMVHMAPDFGEEDFRACREAGIGVVLSVDDEGRFTSDVTDFAGRNIKEADPDLIRWIKDAGRLLRHDTIQHSYPFCYRSDTPLIYRAVPSTFVNVSGEPTPYRAECEPLRSATASLLLRPGRSHAYHVAAAVATRLASLFRR